ncbi:CDGSH iron-sulfur domain-containing protein [bacterium AH-315-N03]|nr:CDGSH iron-sulfur domain-containing protein [bacterium AH-315-N03]
MDVRLLPQALGRARQRLQSTAFQSVRGRSGACTPGHQRHRRGTERPLSRDRVPLGGARLAKDASPEKYVLCRCGASKNKPYRDGSHYDIGWKDSESKQPA